MVIIKPRMPRVLGTKRRIGQLGARSLQRSMIHVRRMLISRLPESLSADLQQAAEQPLGWNELPALTETTQPSGPVVEAPRRVRSQPSQPVQRSSEPSREASSTMPRDLQAIFDAHKRMGRVRSNTDLKSQAEVFNKSGSAILPEEPAQPVQRAAEETSAPATDAPPRRRQVRSKVEYVNRPDPDMVRRLRETSEVQRDVEDTSVDETSLDEEYDFVSTFPPDDLAEDPEDTQQSIQRAVDSAKAPLRRDIDSPSESYSEAYPEHDADSYSEVPQDFDDISTTQQSIRQAVDQAEAPQNFDEPTATQQSIQRAADRAEAPAETYDEYAIDDSAAYTDYESDVDTEYHQPIQRDTDGAIQRAIEAAEAPPEAYPTTLDSQSDTQPTSAHDTARTTPVQRDADDDDDYAQTFIEPSQRRMTVSDPQPPTQIQRTTLPEQLSVEQEAFEGADVEDDYAADKFIYDDYDVSPASSADAAIQRYEEQDVDLSEALFGGDQERGPVPEHDGPTPTLMPPIGKLHHSRPVTEQSMPRQVARRADRQEDKEVSPLDLMRMASASVDADIARDEAIQAAEHPSSVQMSRDDETIGPDDDEARLLTLLDLPADTPIQREGPSMPTPAAPSVQRETEEGGASIEGEAPPGGESGKSLDEQAQEVYDILKRKLRIENERYKGKK